MSKKRIIINTNLYDFVIYYMNLYSDMIPFIGYWGLCIGITLWLYYFCKDEQLFLQIDGKQIDYFQIYKDYFIVCLYANYIYFCACLGLLVFVKPKISNGLQKDLTGIEVIYMLVTLCGIITKTFLFYKYVLDAFPYSDNNKIQDFITPKAKIVDQFILISNLHNIFGSILVVTGLLILLVLCAGFVISCILKAIQYICINIKFTYTKEVTFDDKSIL